VLPDASASPGQRRLFWDEHRADDVYFNDGPRDQVLYVRPRDHHILFRAPATTKGLRAVAVHKRLLSELPSLAGYPHDLWIDIDADFFSNTGIWTRGKASLRFTSQELEHQLERFVGGLERKGAHPVLTTGSLSPGFTHLGDVPAMRRFFYRIGLASRSGCALVFRHRRSDRGDGEWSNRLHGRAVSLDERREYEAVYRLEALDATRGAGLGQLSLRVADPLCRAAVTIVQKVWRTTAVRARAILVSMSRLAGVPGVRLDLGGVRRQYEAASATTAPSSTRRSAPTAPRALPVEAGRPRS
jgi:hypothetical protein